MSQHPIQISRRRLLATFGAAGAAIGLGVHRVPAAEAFTQPKQSNAAWKRNNEDTGGERDPNGCCAVWTPMEGVSFQSGAVVQSTAQCLLHEDTGMYYAYYGPSFPYTVAPQSQPDASWLCVGDGTGSVTVHSVPDAVAAFAAGAKDVRLNANRIGQTIEIPVDATLHVIGKTYINASTSIFVLNKGSIVYAPDLSITPTAAPTVFTVNGRSRPALLLGAGRGARIEAVVNSSTQLGKCLVLDANESDGKKGVISGFNCDIVLRGMGVGCELQVSRISTLPLGTSYINNNTIKMEMWDTQDGLLEPELTPQTEIACNTYWIDYQSSPVSRTIMRIRGIRHRIRGNLWDTDRSAYTNLHAESIDIGGSSNDVGGTNFPSINSNVVTVRDTLGTYVGANYGTFSSRRNHLQQLTRISAGLDNGQYGGVQVNGMALQQRIQFAAGVQHLVRSVQVGFLRTRAPYYLDGWVYVHNPSLTETATVTIHFGPKDEALASSEAIAMLPNSLVRVPLTMVIGETRQAATAGSGTGWIGMDSYSNETSHRIVLKLDTSHSVWIEGYQVSRVNANI